MVRWFARILGALLVATAVHTGRASAVDTDADGLEDEWDNCIDVANPNQRDSNLDGFGNLCDPDYDNDGVVSMRDFTAVLRSYGTNPTSSNWNGDVDCDADLVIDDSDVACLTQRFGAAPGPSGLHCAGAFPCPCTSTLPPCQFGGYYPATAWTDCSYQPPAIGSTYGHCEDPEAPRISVLGSHKNFYTIVASTQWQWGNAGRYQPFAKLLDADGSLVVHVEGDLTTHILSSAGAPDILVTAGQDDRRPFREDEVALIESWVEAGGSLLVIVDHFPYSAVRNLMRAFLPNFDLPEERREDIAGEQGYFFPFLASPSSSSGSLISSSPIACDELPSSCSSIVQVDTFGGTPFCPAPVLDELGAPILCAEQSHSGRDALLVLPTPFPSSSELHYSRYLMGFGFCHGGGRVYVSGEGAMFTKQLGARYVQTGAMTFGWGLGGSYAKDVSGALLSESENQNEELLLNIVHWLAGAGSCPSP